MRGRRIKQRHGRLAKFLNRIELFSVTQWFENVQGLTEIVGMFTSSRIQISPSRLGGYQSERISVT